MDSSAQGLLNPSDYQLSPINQWIYEQSGDPNQSSIYGLPGNISEFLSGTRSAWTNRYNTAQSILDKKYELDFENTKFQRAFKDIEAAGYNPWLMLQNGGLSASGSSAGSSGYSVKQDTKQKSGNLGMFALAAAKLLAILAA